MLGNGLFNMGFSRVQKTPAQPEINNLHPWPRLMWVPIAAEYLGSRPFFVEELIRSGEIAYVLVGNRKCVAKEDLDEWVDRQKRLKCPCPKAAAA